jgi:PAS domain S-box-containing protein
MAILMIGTFYIRGNATATDTLSNGPKTLKVLILNSYHFGNSYSDSEMVGIKSALPADTEYFTEYMDSKRISGNPDYLTLLYQTYQLKYKQKRFDIIFSLDDDAFHFLLKYHNELFPGTPVVFCGLNRYDESMTADQPLITGVVETIDFKETVQLALKLHPDTKRIYVINDNTTSGRIDRAGMETVAKSGEFAVEFEFLVPEIGITLDELLLKLKSLPAHSLVDYVNFYQDSTGEVLAPEEIIPKIAQASPVPIYTQIESFLGSGIVGGKVDSGFYQGEMAAKMALRIMQGEPISSIPIQTKSVNKYIFDFKQLQRWGIPLSALPPDSVLINHQITFFERYRSYILGGAGFVLFETLVIALLILSTYRRRVVEKALRASEERFRRLSENAPDMIYRMSLQDGRYEYISPAAHEITGYSPEEWYQSPKLIQKIIHPDWCDYFDNAWKKLLEGDMPPTYEYQIIHKSGKVKWLHQRNMLVKEDEKPIAIEGIVTDMTERKQAEEALQESERKYRSLFENSILGIFRTTAEGNFIDLNPALAHLFGYASPEEMKNSVNDIGKQVYASPADRDTFQSLISKEKKVKNFEVEFLQKNGQRIWVSINAFAVCDPNGNIISYEGTTEDITERKIAEEALKAKTEELDRYFTSSLDLLCIADTDGHFRRLNPEWERTLGYSTQDLEGKIFLDYVHPDDRDSTLMALAELAGQNEVLNFENRYRCKDGSYRWIEWRSYPVDKLIYAVARDITERKRVEEEINKSNEVLEQRVNERTAQLQAANQELESFTYSVSHDLRSPLRAINGFAKLIKEDYREQLPQEAHRFLDRIGDGAQKMGRLIDDLLLLTRIIRSDMNIAQVNLSAIATEIAQELQSGQPGRSVKFDIQFGLVAQGDVILLKVMMQNLLGNAWKFTSEQPNASIEFGANISNDKQVYFIRDNGAGFDMAYKEKLFGAFQRLHRDNEFPGTGIGLATAKRIINRHGGTIWAEGHVNQGATFYFTLQ